MMLFVYIFVAVTATPQDDLYQKLKNYQNLTGISTEEVNLLWKKRQDPGILYTVYRLFICIGPYT